MRSILLSTLLLSCFAVSNATAELSKQSRTINSDSSRNIVDSLSVSDLELIISILDDKPTEKKCICKCAIQNPGDYMCSNEGPHDENDPKKKCDKDFEVTLKNGETDCTKLNNKICYGYRESTIKNNRVSAGNFKECK